MKFKGSYRVKTGLYQLGVMGRPGGLRKKLIDKLTVRFMELGLSSANLTIIDENEIDSRNKRLPFVCVFFGYSDIEKENHKDFETLKKESAVIIPCVEDLEDFPQLSPSGIAHINGIELRPDGSNIDALASLILENFRLLREERRLFISYKRSESQAVAIQLYEALDSLGFDVFLDTRSVRPSLDFQETLWHRMADSDVVILLDTPKFRESKWTQMELANANATSLQILHLLWPGIDEDKESAMSNFKSLSDTDFNSPVLVGASANFTKELILEIGESVESLRARALAARHQNLVDNFCDQMRAINIIPTVQAERYISLRTSAGNSIAVVPAIGVPGANHFQEIEETIEGIDKFEKIWLLYDESGIRNRWLSHINWLNLHLPLKAVRVSNAEEYALEHLA